jgi:mannosylglycerate hydrolase
MEMASQQKRVFVVVSHTHWDREWYLPFEEFRVRLLGMLDSLLDLLDRDPGFRHFVLDGQTIPVDDYLEVRPDRRPQVERLIQEGRLLIGPNYVLPDEFLIGGESHIRNLMFGIRSGRQYGRVMMTGYSPDAFGHIAHLPAVLRGFGLDSVLVWRGVGDEAVNTEFRWRAPDGSEVLAVHFAYGYGYMAVIPEDQRALANLLQNTRNLLEPLASTRYVLVPNGTDHLPAHEGLPDLLRRANAILSDAEIIHSDYPAYVDLVRQELGGRYDTLPLIEGELRSSKRSNILAGVLSTRIWLKQQYQECEDLLARYAEPAAAWAHLMRSADGDGGGQKTLSAKSLLRHAWKLLLQNGPHDSVTGCSADEVYLDVANRFTRCRQIASTVLHQAQRHIAGLAAPPHARTAVVFNSENGPRSDFCTVRVPVEGGRLPVRAVDPDGRSTPVQVLERGGYSPRDARERALAGFVAPDIPGFGYKAFSLEFGQPAPAQSPPSSEVIENEYFRVSADTAAATVTVEDKRTGVTYTGLNRFVDTGEAGDEYTHSPPESDLTVEDPSGPVSVSITETGPVRRTLELRMTYRLPARLTGDRKGRADGRAECPLVTRVHLYAGLARVDFQTEVENNAEDHRLRVHFPTGVRAGRSHAEQHFGVVERPLALPDYDATWVETPVATHPQKTFVDISDGARGVMVANRGLPEYQAIPEDDGTVTIALTLLRCVGWLSRDDLRSRRGHAGPPMFTPGAQMPGRWRFEYSFIPHEGGWRDAYHQAHWFARPLRTQRMDRGRGLLPAAGSLLAVDPPDVALSTIKLAEDDNDVVVRVYNMAPEATEAEVRLNTEGARARRVDLNEERPEEPAAANGGVGLSLKANEIVTLKFRT